MSTAKVECPASSFVDLGSPEFLTPKYLDLKDHVKCNKARLADLKIDKNHIFKRRFAGNLIQTSVSKLWLPVGLRETVIINAHNPPLSSHGGGVAKTLKRIKRCFYWPGMSVQVKNFIGKCDTCKESKAPNYTLRPPMGQQFLVDRPFQHLYKDFLGPYVRSKNGNTHLFIALDQLIKFGLLKPLRKANTKLINTFLENEVFHLFDVP